MEGYYYNQLDKSGQNAYHAMKTGLLSLAPSFPVPRLDAVSYTHLRAHET